MTHVKEDTIYKWIPVKADNDNKISDEELDRILDGGVEEIYPKSIHLIKNLATKAFLDAGLSKVVCVKLKEQTNN